MVLALWSSVLEPGPLEDAGTAVKEGGELPSIYHLEQYPEGLDGLPDYRVTCFFVDKGYRRKGVAAVALRGTLDLI